MLSEHIFGGSMSALPVFSLRIVVYGLLFVLIWHPGLATSLWNRLVFVYLKIFSVCNLLCSVVFHFTHFISFHFMLLYFVCLLVFFYFIIGSKVYLVICFRVFFLLGKVAVVSWFRQ